MPTLTILYDADCGVCRLTILALKRLDWLDRLRPAPLQAFEDDHPTRDELAATLHVRDRSGRWARGGDAARRIAEAVPVLMPLGVAGHLPGMRRVMDAAYRSVANHRGAISRVLGLETCVPGLRAGTGE